MWELLPRLRRQVADDVLALRELLAEFVSRSVGHPPTDVHMAATDVLSQLFSEHAGGLEAGDEDDEESLLPGTPRSEKGGGGREAATAAPPATFPAGASVECYWPETEEYLPATVLKAQADGSYIITWDEDESHSEVQGDYLRARPSRQPTGGGPPPKRAAAQPYGNGAGRGKWARR